MQMKKIVILLFFSVVSLNTLAQSAREEIAKNPLLAGNQSVIYPGAPTEKLTPAPKGYRPVYLNHYGRHGSRFDWGYAGPVKALEEARAKGKLTDIGEQTLSVLQELYQEAYMREGELTPLGARQHKEIAMRMYKNFPEIFAQKNTTIDAKSTILIRCILSMENALQELSVRNPHLQIKHDASEHDMYYMNRGDHKLDSIKKANEYHLRNFEKSLSHPERLMGVLFTDKEYWQQHVKADQLMRQIFNLAVHTQNTELSGKVDLISLFSNDELYDQWQMTNALWYMNNATSPLTESKEQFVARHLLKRMISEADSCLALPYPNASLRYGHDSNVLPLVCLMQLNGWDGQYKLEELGENGWCAYKIIPMAANIQMVYYRSKDSSKPILVKVLHNEKEASLPIETDQWPYYKWDDVKTYYLNRINSVEI